MTMIVCLRWLTFDIFDYKPLQTVLNYMGQFYEISIVYHTLYLWNEDGDPHFFFGISGTGNSLSAGSENIKKIQRQENFRANVLKVGIHGAILRAMTKLHRVSTPKIVARNIAAVEFRPTSATLRPTNFFVYPLSAAFRAILWRKSQCSANQISHSNLTADLNVTRRTFHVKRKRWFDLLKKGVR